MFPDCEIMTDGSVHEEVMHRITLTFIRKMRSLIIASQPFQLIANRCVFGMLFSVTSRNTTQDNLPVKWSVTFREISLSGSAGFCDALS